jgi:hypothetical protein
VEIGFGPQKHAMRGVVIGGSIYSLRDHRGAGDPPPTDSELNTR